MGSGITDKYAFVGAPGDYSKMNLHPQKDVYIYTNTVMEIGITKM